MKPLSVVVAASAAVAVVAHATSGIPTRKSLAFGPRLQHAKYTTLPQSPSSFTSVHADNSKRTAEKAAIAYVKDVLGHPNDAELGWRLRDDSYLDESTGVWHLYFKQLVYSSLQVADGDVNINVWNGKVISSGDSFYRGPVPPLNKLPAASYDQAHYCSQLRSALTEQIASDAQVPLSVAPEHSYSDRYTKLYEHNCLSLHSLDPEHYASNSDNRDFAGAQDAALYFIVAAHPSTKVAKSILENFGEHRQRISTSFEHNLQHAGPPVEFLSNVPGTTAPVKATMALVQAPCTEDSQCVDGQTSVLRLVWKLEVEMRDNWYEAYVDAHTPTQIVTAIDWVSDSSAHETTSHKCWPAPEVDAAAPVPKKPKTDKNGVPVSTYRVWPWGINDPEEGNRDIVKSPYDVTASPLGWHAIPSKHNPGSDSTPYFRGLNKGKHGDDDEKDVVCNFTTTWGNNVQAQENWEGRNSWLRNYRPDGNSNLTFVFPYGAGKKHYGETVEPKSYIDLVVTQLFVTTNMVHDLYYRYGFTELAGNFQNYNFGKGGKEDDAVIAHAQDGSGYNNANFATPPDGQHGRMRMYVWDTASPFRDGDLEAGIVIHELSHGLSTRLTGGPANSGCLGWGESGGMGEGWGDFLATVIRSTANYSDYPMGSWAANREKGIRNFKYSLNMTTNPSTYKTLDSPGYWGVHAIGEVWAQILFVVYHRLVEKHGFSETLFPPQPNANGTYDFPNDFYNEPHKKGGAPIPKHGNTLIVQLVLNGMKLQPCRPNFFDARNAIIQADEVLTGGENVCDLWEGFASRGLGPDATIKGGTPWGGGIRKNDFELPVKCGGKEKKPDDDDY